LFTRFRLRGLYVGFITSSPIHGCTTFEDELEKIAARRQNGQREALSRSYSHHHTPALEGALTFANALSSFDAPTEFAAKSPTPQ
jgi:hypothetical protein